MGKKIKITVKKHNKEKQQETKTPERSSRSMDKKEIKNTIKDLARYCCADNTMRAIVWTGKFDMVVHILHYFEYMLDDRNCCSYIIEGIEDYCKAHSIVSNDPIQNRAQVTTDGESTFTMEFKGEDSYRTHYWGKLTITTNEDEWALCFNLAGELTKISKDPDIGCFVRHLYPKDNAAVA